MDKFGAKRQICLILMAIKIQVGPKKEKMKKEKKIFMRKSFLFVAKHGTIVPLLLFILTEPGVPVHF